MPQSIYLADDEKNIRDLIALFLSQEGFSVQTFSDGDALLSACKHSLPDLVMLDIMMPGTDGLSICSQLRQENSDLPIIIVSAKDSPFDRVTGLTLGSDDYLIKPFLPQELVARVRALLRRSQKALKDGIVPCELAFGTLTLSPNLHTAVLNHEPLTLTPTEFDFLSYMIMHQERAVSRDELLQTLWKMDWQSDTRAADDLVKRLRRKLRARQSNIRIETVWGFGFRLALEEDVM
ncbi:response regulator transcription factor [Clostridium transplantifaecale]|uniref:response regulator transcription factor n=1 Tax=Clostridium transplantifaecale TaxID=2479838 RepID=UPI000F63940E|nr:response regulator transcription factor [Clostridium transplantifaecale]